MGPFGEGNILHIVNILNLFSGALVSYTVLFRYMLIVHCTMYIYTYTFGRFITYFFPDFTDLGFNIS